MFWAKPLSGCCETCPKQVFWAQSVTGNVSERLSYGHFGSLRPENRVLECLNGPNWFWHQERRARRSFGQKGKIEAIWEWGCIGERRARRTFGQKCPKMPQKSPIFSTFGTFLAGHGGPAGIPNRGVFGGVLVLPPNAPFRGLSEQCSPAHFPLLQIQRVVCCGFQGMFRKCQVECLTHRTESLLLGAIFRGPSKLAYTGLI